MKINKLLEQINKGLINKEREEKGIKVRGYFMSATQIDKGVGPYKIAKTTITYINQDTNKNEEVIRCAYCNRAPEEKLDKFKEDAFMDAIVKFISFFIENKQKIILGEYGS